MMNLRLVNPLNISRLAAQSLFKYLGALAIGLMCANALIARAASVDYKNPVIPGDHPDPSIIRVGNDFWATCTSSEWGPQFPLLHSKDLVNWELVGSVFPQRPKWAVGNFWAPEIAEYNGHFFVYYVARERGGPLAVAVATADKPEGPYVDHGPMVAQSDGSIDPAPATDENGIRYLIWKEDGNSRGQPTIIWAQRLNEDGTKLMGERHELIRNDSDWEGAVVEGPYILRHNGWFYLFYSGNGCCGPGCNYAFGVARSRKLLGPWEKNPKNPILFANETWKCPGHGSIVTDQAGRFWLLYHAYPANGSVFVGREAMLDEVKFGTNDWPTINDSKGPSVEAASPFNVAQRQSDKSFLDDFTGNKLNPSWQWSQQREPLYELKDGQLTLTAGDHKSGEIGAVLAHSTLSANYEAQTVVDAKALKPDCSAGLCAIGDLQNAMGIAARDGKIILWRRYKREMHQLSEQSAPETEKLYLRLIARAGYQFQFSFSADGKDWTDCGQVADEKNLPPWDRSVRVGLTVGGKPDASAQFDMFSLKPINTVQKK